MAPTIKKSMKYTQIWFKWGIISLRSLSGWCQLYFGRFIYWLQRDESRLKEVRIRLRMSGSPVERGGYRMKMEIKKVEDGNCGEDARVCTQVAMGGERCQM